MIYHIILYHLLLHCIRLYYMILYYIILHYIIYTTLYQIILYYIILCYSMVYCNIYIYIYHICTYVCFMEPERLKYLLNGIWPLSFDLLGRFSAACKMKCTISFCGDIDYKIWATTIKRTLKTCKVL